MKYLYTSPKVTVEELTKIDVLCSSTERNTTAPDPATSNSQDSINQQGSTLGNVTGLL